MTFMEVVGPSIAAVKSEGERESFQLVYLMNLDHHNWGSKTTGIFGVGNKNY